MHQGRSMPPPLPPTENPAIFTFRSATTFHKSTTVPFLLAPNAAFASSAQTLNKSSWLIPKMIMMTSNDN